MTATSSTAILPAELTAMAGQTRIWIYTLDRDCSTAEINHLNQEIKSFVQSWTSHNRQLSGFGGIVYDRFVILAVDESAANASGCSIDKSVSFMTQLGHRYGFNPFDRWLFGIFDSQGELRILNRTELVSAVQQGHVHDDTWCLDNLVDNLNDLKSDWKKRFGDCWIKRVI